MSLVGLSAILISMTSTGNDTPQDFKSPFVTLSQSRSHQKPQKCLRLMHTLPSYFLIKERQLRRSFCASRHEEGDLRLYPPESVHLSEQDVRKRVEVTYFLIRKCLYPQLIHAKPLRGWLGLLRKDFEEDGTCLVEEILYYSDAVSENGLWITPTLDIHPMSKPLSFRITLEQAKRFPRLKAPENVYSYELQYELLVTLDGHILS